MPKKAKAVSEGITKRLDDKDTSKKWELTETEKAVQKYVSKRVREMQDFRKGLKIEPMWREADAEYIPNELSLGKKTKKFETDELTGLRSRLVPVGDGTKNWRSNASAPTLLAKIQTAISIIVHSQPEAELTPLVKKFNARTAIAYALWKRNWSVTEAKEKLKLVIFNLFKYGWAPQRTYPRKVEYNKRVLVEKDPENPENDKYEDKKICVFNDVDREPLDPFRTWIDEQSRPYDRASTKESYYEVDYSYDDVLNEFGIYPNIKCVKPDSAMIYADQTARTGQSSDDPDKKLRKDIVTLGFFESRNKDLFAIVVPKDGYAPLYQSPLPNDDGYISVTHTLLMLRNARLPYGVSLWEIIRQDKAMYDKWNNMTMDQLTLAIMKFGFHNGVLQKGDGTIQISPGESQQITSQSGKPEVVWMDIPGPGEEAWKGLEYRESKMNDNSGISPTLQGEVTGKTLGETQLAREASLKRMEIPLENISWLIEQDAYLTLSWMSQIYSIPTVMDFADEEEMRKYEEEEMIDRHEMFVKLDLETGKKVGIQASYLPQLALHLEDRAGEMVESGQSQYLQVGKDIEPYELRWEGIFKVMPRSIVDSSQTLVKATKMEMFNVLMPLFQFPPELMAKAAEQIVKVNEEDPKDWLPDAWLAYLNQPKMPMMPGMGGPMAPMGQPPMQDQSIFVPANGQQQSPAAPVGAQQTMQAGMSMTPPQAQTIIPKGQIAPGGAGVFNRKV